MKDQIQKLKTSVAYPTTSNQLPATEPVTLVFPKTHYRNPFDFSRPGNVHLYQVHGFKMGVIK